MEEEEYLELLDDDPDKALKWLYESRFVFNTMGEGIQSFDDDLLADFLEKLLAHFSLTKKEAVALLNGDEDSEFTYVCEELCISADEVAGNCDDEPAIELHMDWERASPWETIDLLETLGFDLTFYGYEGPVMGQAGSWFIR